MSGEVGGSWFAVLDAFRSRRGQRMFSTGFHKGCVFSFFDDQDMAAPLGKKAHPPTDSLSVGLAQSASTEP